MDTILIVDDKKNYPPIISAVLEEEGFETLTANSGMEALDIFNNADIDLDFKTWNCSRHCGQSCRGHAQRRIHIPA